MIIRLFTLLCLLAGGALAQSDASWTEQFPAFKIVGNVYYVGSRGLASYLIVTPQGDILINSNLQSSAPQIRNSVEEPGFHFSDVKILFISHAHWDHDAGSAEIKKLTGARYMVMEGDVPVVESGVRPISNMGILQAICIRRRRSIACFTMATKSGWAASC